MKSLKKIIMGLLFFLILLLNVNVNADSYNGKLYELYHPNSGFTVFAEEKGRNMDYNSWMIKSTIDNDIYYCIDPAIPLEGAVSGSHNQIIGKDTIVVSTKLTKTKYDKVRLIAYYGYGYKDKEVNHTNKKWYGITQVMIWRIMRPDLSWTFKANRNATPDSSLYVNEIQEINDLVKIDKKRPSFMDKTVKILRGKEMTLVDSNNVFKYYYNSSLNDKVKISTTNNSVTIKGIKNGKGRINFSRNLRTSSKFALLTSTKYQDIVRMGYEEVVAFPINFEIVGGDLKLKKVDKESVLVQGDATLEGAVYKIYDESGKYIDKLITSKDGEAQITLDYGKYTLKETTSPQGYKINDKVYQFEINEGNTDVSLNVDDDVIKGKLEIKKLLGGSGEPYKPEENAVFELYDSKNVKIKELITDKDGKVEVVLPYGKYVLKQIKGKDKYVFESDKEINITKEKTYTLNLKNKKLSKLEITKIDEDTKQKIIGTIFEIYNIKDEKIFEGSTDKYGKLVVENIEIGKYYIKEKQASKYYNNNTNNVEFEIKENGVLEKINITNKRKKGNLEFYKIDEETGEKLSGATIKIINEETGQELTKGTTGKDGMFKLNDIRASKYCIYETNAPKEYQLEQKPVCFEIVEENETVRVSMSNKKIINVPNTFKNEISIASIGIVIAILGTVIYVKKKN